MESLGSKESALVKFAKHTRNRFMDLNSKLGHIVAYYLSRFDKTALKALGFKTDKEAFTYAAQALGLVPNYIKFRRDEFDVVHPYRQGWHKRPMTPSIFNTINALQDLNEFALREIVIEVLNRGAKAENFDNIDRLMSIFPSSPYDKKKTSTAIFIPRGITGNKAEEIFLGWYSTNNSFLPKVISLIDTRDHGCGYDFQLTGVNGETFFVEIKGLASEGGGVVFTNKEWETAITKGNNYYLVLINNIDTIPTINVIQNPAVNISAKRNITTVVQVSWQVSARDISNSLAKLNLNQGDDSPL